MNMLGLSGNAIWIGPKVYVITRFCQFCSISNRYVQIYFLKCLKKFNFSIFFEIFEMFKNVLL